MLWSHIYLRNEAMEFINQNYSLENIFLPIGLEPSTILVRPDLKPSFKYNWPRDLTLLRNDIIIPITTRKKQ